MANKKLVEVEVFVVGEEGSGRTLKAFEWELSAQRYAASLETGPSRYHYVAPRTYLKDEDGTYYNYATVEGPSTGDKAKFEAERRRLAMVKRLEDQGFNADEVLEAFSCGKQ